MIKEKSVSFFVSGNISPFFLRFDMKKELKNNFDGKKLAKIGIFTAISFVLTYIEFPLFPQAPFLKLDFSNVFVLIGGFSLGPVSGIIILIAKEALCLIKTSTVVGQLANLLIGFVYVIVPFILYLKKRTFSMAVVGLIIGSIIHTCVALLVNKYVNFPLYGLPRESYESLRVIILLFNFIKSVAVSVLTLVLYKRVKRIINF